ncbi:serine protease FAM111A-like [Solea solea]|uniref:serine protease FAM111A-like n=1 Tax=Solea solea TaxID=90069 RepID=UPI00272C4DD8|nr:serine protease FAM111A-like [Solea solea]
MASSSDCHRKIKEERDDDLKLSTGHSHIFTVKFKNKEKKHTVLCESLCTVLDAMKSNEKIRQKITCPDENIVIQRGTGDNECTIATHFPCTLLEMNENLLVLMDNKIIERKTKEDLPIRPEEEYAIFFIDKDFGRNAKTKPLFRSNALKNSKYVCIYGDKEITVVEALQKDGRFVNDFDSFYLEDIDKKEHTYDCTMKIMVLHGNKFKICMERMKKEAEGAKGSDNLQETPGAHQKGVSVIRAGERTNDDNTEEIRQILCDQFPQLRALMEKRVRQRPFEELLELKKENFGKIQQSFSEVHRVRELLKLSKSVCKIVVYGICEGTGFVLFDDLILTNAHLFDKVQPENHVPVYALFDFELPQPETDYCGFSCEKEFIDIDKELDYAVLKLCPGGERSKSQSKKSVVIPPGLLKKFGPVPENGEACIIGHPQGDIKKMDPTCIIEEEERIKEINEHVSQYKDTVFIIQSVVHELKNQGIENILKGGAAADKCVTYNTFMYHGSSGSPVFDQSCQVFGLHTAGYTYTWPKGSGESVIEYALPLLHIFNKFVSNLREKNNETLLERITEEAKGNQHLKDI